MFKFTSIFFENLVVDSAMSLNTSVIPPSTLGSSLSSSVTSTGTEICNLGTNIADNSDSDLLDTIGTISTSIGTSVSINSVSAYEKTMQQLETTQAYIESLNEQELEELISKLETKEYQISLEEDTHGKSL